MTTSLADAIAAGPVLLDGGLSTHLETMGHDLTQYQLWSARLIADAPDAIADAHTDFFDAGAQVATSATYQASFDGFSGIGLGADEATRLMRAGVALAVRARDKAAADGSARWAAASVGPYGATLADGSEYRGDYGRTVAELREWHRPRLAVLADAGADVLAVETIPCAAEVEALVAELAGSGLTAWISVSAALRGGVPCTAAGEPLSEVFALTKGVDEIIAVGVNCCDPQPVAEMVRAATEASGKPGIVYPNRGERWDAHLHQWIGNGRFEPSDVRAWLDAGARLIGGCCRVEPDAIAAIGAQLNAA